MVSVLAFGAVKISSSKVGKQPGGKRVSKRKSNTLKNAFQNCDDIIKLGITLLNLPVKIIIHVIAFTLITWLAVRTIHYQFYSIPPSGCCGLQVVLYATDSFNSTRANVVYCLRVRVLSRNISNSNSNKVAWHDLLPDDWRLKAERA